MARDNKILVHPDKEEIIKWLLEGVSVRDVEKRLAQRYKKKSEAHLRVSHSTIQIFKTKHLNLKGKMLQDIKEHNVHLKTWAKMKEEQEAVEEVSAYKEAIAGLAKEELNAKDELLKVFGIIESRMEALFNKASESDFVNRDVEKLLQGNLDQFMKVLDQYQKYIEGFKETTEHNINITVMNDQVTVLREAIRETLAEMDHRLAVDFMNRLNIKMRNLVFEESRGDEKSVNAMFLNKALGGKNES